MRWSRETLRRKHLFSKAATDSTVSDKNRAPALILQRQVAPAGRQAGGGQSEIREALKLDPGSLAARHYLSLLQEPPGSNPYPRTNLVRSSPGHETIMQESDLDEIIKDRIREQFGDRTNFIKALASGTDQLRNIQASRMESHQTGFRFDWKRSHFPACH